MRLYNSSLTVGIGSGINKTITNSVKNPIALVIIPFVSKAAAEAEGGYTASLYRQYKLLA